jgi:geranylgeranyl pyrophosphate synthase
LTTLNFSLPVQEQIPQVEARMRDHANGHHPDLHAALEHLLASGGKRIRPTVSLLVGAMIGAPERHLITLAAAIELLHTATLVHDDLIDGALLRRGNPTLNSEWSPAATILTGDYIFAQAARFASETESVDIMRLFSETLSVIVNGEIAQIFDGKGIPTREEYFKRIYAKTASMFELAAVAPVYLCDVDEQVLEAMRRYGYEIGMAFQIIDDILDFTSQQDAVGKPVVSDLRRGLITLPVLCYLDQYPQTDISRLLKEGRLSDKTIGEVIANIQESSAVEVALSEAEQFIDRGLEALHYMPLSLERQSLEDLAAYVVARLN